jgi:competence protein ComEC
VGAFLLLTLAAQITTLPLMIYYFKRLSLTALIANPLILPAQPLLMVLGGLAVIGGLFFQPLGQLLAWLAWPFAAYTIRMVELISTIPHGSLAVGQIALPLIFIFYLVLFLMTYFHPRLSNFITKLSPSIPLVGLLAVTVLVWRAAYASPDGLLHVTIMDVGTGEAVLIQTPSGRNVLINGGSSTIRLSDTLGRGLPPFYRSLDWLVVSGIGNQDLSGVPGNIERFPPTEVLWSGNTYGSRSASRLWEDLLSTSIPITPMQTGQVLDLGSGAALEVLSENARGAVLLLRWGNFRLLLPDGSTFEDLQALQRDTAMRNISALLLAESGLHPSTRPVSSPSASPLACSASPPPTVMGSPLLKPCRPWKVTTSCAPTRMAGSAHHGREQMWVEVESR